MPRLLFLALIALIAGAATAAEPVPVLILTGNDYPGHKWKETTPVLEKALAADARLKITVVDQPDFLKSPDLHKYKVVVLHWMNWKTPDPGTEARANLQKFVENGGGLVMVHFACGAFQEWPEFVKIAGRVWDPKLRGHDPHGQFTVNIKDAEHPTTRGMKDFATTDELYTCLTGEVKMHVVASAISKVDKKEYPMAFVLEAGKGKVFHSVLGHDVKALSTPEVQELYRRGTAWSAGMEMGK